jgi:hypothetical protein
MITSIHPAGMFIPECSISGETRADGAWPAMGDAIQLSAERWLVVYSTRGFLGVDQGYRGSDNDRSIIYQLRQGSPLGPVLKEGVFARYGEEPNPFGDPIACLRQHCHTGAFGVPKGALVRGECAAHENVFAASWYRLVWAKGTGPEDVPPAEYYQRLLDHAFWVEWVQFRLADDERDIEILQPPRRLRQKGYEHGEAFCSAEPRCRMNKWFVKPAAYNDDMSEWVQVPHFARGIAAIRFKFNASTGLYEWVQTGPMLVTGPQEGGLDENAGHGRQLTETSVVRHKDSWIVCARSAERLSKTVPGVAWLRTDDLFKPLPEPVYPGAPLSKSPCAAFRCPDGVLRLFTNDQTLSPYRDDRNPLYCWDISPDDGFKATNTRVVFDAIEAGIPVREQSWVRLDMPNLLPHAGGSEQLVTFRVKLRERKAPHTRLTDEEKRRSGLYHAHIRYEQDYPAAWEFAEAASEAVSSRARRST